MVISEEPGKLVEYFPEYFDKILIDAPCSGEGMFRKDKKMVKAWEEHGPEFFSKLQRSIITQAAAMLKPGGMILYSTCTFDPLENEKTVEYLLETCPEFKICEMEGYEGFCEGIPKYVENHSEEYRKTVRIFPHKMQGEGHYLALVKKGDDNAEGKNEKPAKPKGGVKKLPEELEQFLQIGELLNDRHLPCRDPGSRQCADSDRSGELLSDSLHAGRGQQRDFAVYSRCLCHIGGH